MKPLGKLKSQLMGGFCTTSQYDTKIDEKAESMAKLFEPIFNAILESKEGKQSRRAKISKLKKESIRLPCAYTFKEVF
jgi:hypothetical protein